MSYWSERGMPEREEQLKDPRWKKKRKQILSRANGHCEQCGKKVEEGMFQVHHEDYIGVLIWQYPNSTLRALCIDCHQEKSHEEQKAKAVKKKEYERISEEEEAAYDLMESKGDKMIKENGEDHIVNVVEKSHGKSILPNEEKYNEEFEKEVPDMDKGTVNDVTKLKIDDNYEWQRLCENSYKKKQAINVSVGGDDLIRLMELKRLTSKSNRNLHKDFSEVLLALIRSAKITSYN